MSGNINTEDRSASELRAIRQELAETREQTRRRTQYGLLGYIVPYPRSVLGRLAWWIFAIVLGLWLASAMFGTKAFGQGSAASPETVAHLRACTAHEVSDWPEDARTRVLANFERAAETLDARADGFLADRRCLLFGSDAVRWLHYLEDRGYLRELHRNRSRDRAALNRVMDLRRALAAEVARVPPCDNWLVAIEWSSVFGGSLLGKSVVLEVLAASDYERLRDGRGPVSQHLRDWVDAWNEDVTDPRCRVALPSVRVKSSVRDRVLERHRARGLRN